MPYNGSGGTSQPASSIYPATANTLIESAKFNISIADIYTMLAGVICKDGQTTTTQRIPFASGIQTDTVTEKTSDTGVTLDSVLLKDGRIDTMQGSDIVCSATLNLETATGNVVDVTGSTGPVTAVTLSQGHWRLVRFTGTPTLQNGASLVLPNAVDHVCTAGDYVLFVGYASSVVRAMIFPLSAQLPFIDTSPVVIGSADKTKKVRIEADGITTATTRVWSAQDKDITVLGQEDVATQANQETATSTTTFVSPGRQQFHPSAAKAWVQYDQTGSMASSYNVSSVTDNGVGNLSPVWNVDFSSTAYTVLASPEAAAANTAATTFVAQILPVGRTAGGCNITTLRMNDFAATDVSFVNVVAYGDQ